MRNQKLFLEQRIAAVRTALNDGTMRFCRRLPTEAEREQFRDFILACYGTLNGERDARAELRKQLKAVKP